MRYIHAADEPHSQSIFGNESHSDAEPYDISRRMTHDILIDATVDSRSERLGYKLRQAQLDRLPYMLVVGNKEQEENTVSVRSRFAGDEGSRPLADFIADICEEIRTKTVRKEEPKDDGKDDAK